MADEQRFATARQWLDAASHGQCGETVDDDRGDCTYGFKGNLLMPSRDAETWQTAVTSCMALCLACARCNYISVSTKFHDCSWYHGPCCLSHAVQGFRSGPVSNASLPLARSRDRRRAARRSSARTDVDAPGSSDLSSSRAVTLAGPSRCNLRSSAAAAAWQTAHAAPQRSRADEDRILLVGVLSVPANFDRRAWIRHHTRAMGRARGMHIQFVFGVGCPLNIGERTFFELEQRRHPEDMYMLNGTSDCMTPYIFHKTLAWYESALVTHPGYAWYGKSDDDSLINLPRLRTDLLAASATAALACDRPDAPPYAYYGPMRWRLWHPSGYGGCGAFDETGPPFAPPNALKRDASACGAGPFPYADGSLHVLSAALAAAVMGSVPAERVARVVAGLCSKQGVARPPRGVNGVPLRVGFLEEDVGTGYLVASTAALHQLPVLYFPLIKWLHNRFWVTLRDEHTLPDESVVVVHKIKDAITAHLSARAFRHMSTRPSAGVFTCVDCQTGWGWSTATTPWGAPPIENMGCCARTEVAAGGGNASRPRTADLVAEMSVGLWG